MKRQSLFERFSLILGVVSFLCVLFGACYAAMLANAMIVPLGRTFYYLVSETEYAVAAAQFSYSQGGAGYLLERGDEVYAVLACYTTLSVSETVCKNLQSQNISTSIREEKCDELYLQSPVQKQNADKIVGCFKTLDDCIQILGKTAEGAGDGEFTQSRLKMLVEDVSNALIRLAKDNGQGVCSSIADCALTAAERLKEAAQGIVYAKDILYVQAYLCDGYFQFFSKFRV